MISTDELRFIADQHDLSEADVQRDYVFGWLISGLYRESGLGDVLVLKGGNALRKAYFQQTRFSDDLDFTTEQAVDRYHLLAELNKVCQFVGDVTGVPFDIDRNDVVAEHQISGMKKVYKVKLYFEDFLTGAKSMTISVRMDVTEYDRLHLPVQERQLIHPYSDADTCATTIRCIKLEEALAEKMKCLLQRRYCYDLYDLAYGAFVAREIDLDRAEMLRVFLAKTIFGGSPQAARDLLLSIPLDLFRGYWHKVVTPGVARMSFDDATSAIRSGVESLFEMVPPRPYRAAAYFPAELRNPILQAGSEKKLLRLTYKGIPRVVEPYSLNYKRRKSDGVAQEYFYVWDRTGGRSGPGTKALLNGNVQAVEILDETFEPQFPIQLSKAGDASSAGTFAAQGRGQNRSTWLGGAGTQGVDFRYLVQCNYCGREFRRKKRSVRMNKHNDSFGNNCRGRSGTVVRSL